jgi:thiol-disulfide isomerase/thioredoxin
VPAGIVVVVATLAVASVLGLALRHRNGRFQETTAPTPARETAAPSEQWRMLESLGVTPGPDVTLLQFSTVFCGPCRTTRALCAEVARTVPGVRHLEVDAEAHLEAVRALDIWRTPTVFVIDHAGVIVSRAAGAPSRAQLLGVVGAIMPKPATP